MCIICADYQYGYITLDEVESIVDDKSPKELESMDHQSPAVRKIINRKMETVNETK